MTNWICVVEYFVPLFFQGVVPATGFLKGSGINITDRGFVTVNKVCIDARSVSFDYSQLNDSICLKAVKESILYVKDFVILKLICLLS